MQKFMLGALAALVVVMAGPQRALAQQQSDAVRFTDPVSARGASISPDGAKIAYVRRIDTGEQLIVVDLATHRGRPVQTIAREDGRINWAIWKGNERLVISGTFYRTQEGRAHTGSRRTSADVRYSVNRTFALNTDGSHVVQMFQGQMNALAQGYGSTFLVDDLPSDPNHILIAAWDSSGTGAWLGDVNTGAVQRVANGTDYTGGYTADSAGYPVLRTDYFTDLSGYRISRRAPGATEWTQVFEARRAAAVNAPDFEPIASGPTPGKVYVIARPNNANFAALYLYDTATGEFGQPLQTTAHSVDAVAPWINPITHELMATCEVALRLECQSRDPAIQRNLRAVNAFFENAAVIHFAGMSQDGNKWLLLVDGPTEPGGYYLYEINERRVSPVADLYPNLQAATLSPTQVVNYQAHDGTALWAYVTAQPGQTGPRPTVIMPHGGPEVRDEYRYDSFVQFLASKGYVVVQPNFRGGGGFGRDFANAGHGQWGKLMQDDVTDAVRHMIQSGVADPQRICIVGASYGGYAALAGVALTPDLYRCAVSIAGISDLEESVHAEVAGGGRASMSYQYWLVSIGNPSTMSAQLEATSPRRLADRITAPVLLIHGEEDQNVPIRQSELMAQALRGAGHPARLVKLEDEDHYWDLWSRESRLTVFQEVDAFLAQNIAPR